MIILQEEREGMRCSRQRRRTPSPPLCSHLLIKLRPPRPARCSHDQQLHHNPPSSPHHPPLLPCPKTLPFTYPPSQFHPIQAHDDFDNAFPRLLPFLDVAPPFRLYQHLLKLCQRKRALALDHTLFLLFHLVAHQCNFLGSLGDSLVFTLSRCGALEDALHVFNVLPSRSVFSWTSMISGYVEYGYNMDALRMLMYMREDGLEPDKYVFVSVLKACGNIRDIELGRKLHFDAQQRGFVSDVYVGSTLVSVYGKCGYVAEAENVFCDLHCRNIVSWNAMLSAYVDQNQCERALLLFRQMQKEGQTANELTYAISIQSCSIISQNGATCCTAMGSTREISLGIGQALHSDVRKKNLDSHPLIGNTLVTMYGKFGVLCGVENMFDSLLHRDVVTWNTIRLAYVEQGHGRKSLQMHKLMYEELVSPDEHTFAISLQACCSLVEEEDMIMDGETAKRISLGIGQALYADIERKGFMADTFIASTLMNLYGKCAMVEISERIFSELPERDVVAWSAMISAYVEHGLGQKGLQAYRQMSEEGVQADQHAMVATLQACGVLGDDECNDSLFKAACEIGHALHADGYRRRYTTFSPVCNSLVNMYGKYGMLTEAQYVFDGLPQRNVVSWNSMLSAFIEQGKIVEALQLYPKMLEENVAPDELTYLIILQSLCGYAEETLHLDSKSMTKAFLEIGEALHTDALRRGLTTSIVLHDAIVNLYIKSGDLGNALVMLNASPHRGSLAWNVALSAFAEQGQGNIALQIYDRIQDSGIVVFPTTMVQCLQACCEISSLETCRHLHFSIVAVKLELISTIANTLVHTYGSCGCMEDSRQVFDGLMEPDVVSWNACLAGYARQGDNIHCLEEKMRASGIDPNEVSFLSLLSACSHAGDIGRGIKYLESMCRDYSLILKENHHAVMVDLLGRAGNFRHVEDLLLWRVQGQADVSRWERLLGACRTHSNVELGRWAFEQAVHSHPEMTSVYIWMWNIYAADAAEEEQEEGVE